jgi:predicted nucleic acid-binding protein
VSFLLDTNLVSEWTKPRPNTGVAVWLAEQDEDRVYLSVVTIAELRHGIERLAAGRRRSRLDEWLRDELPQRFEARVLPVSENIADVCGRVVARREALGRPIQAMDALLAATAAVHELTLVTRNVADFEAAVKSIVNPWT